MRKLFRAYVRLLHYLMMLLHTQYLLPPFDVSLEIFMGSFETIVVNV